MRAVEIPRKTQKLLNLTVATESPSDHILALSWPVFLPTLGPSGWACWARPLQSSQRLHPQCYFRRGKASPRWACWAWQSRDSASACINKRLHFVWFENTETNETVDRIDVSFCLVWKLKLKKGALRRPVTIKRNEGREITACSVEAGGQVEECEG